MRHGWKGGGVKREKINLMNSLVRSVMMYGVEIWGSKEMRRLDKIQTRYCKYICARYICLGQN